MSSSFVNPLIGGSDALKEFAISLGFMVQSLGKLIIQVYKLVPGGTIVVKYIKKSHQNDPLRTVLEIFLFIFMLWYFGRKRSRPAAEGSIVQLTEKEIDELCADWEPESLTRPLTDNEKLDLEKTPIIVGSVGTKVKLQDGKERLNLASYNFLGVMNNEELKDHAIKALRKYGVGTCGPCGFYGTVDAHLDLEKSFAKFIGCEAAICYAQGFSAVSSIIPAFSKRGDIIIADEYVNFAIQKGLQISKSAIKFYKHNDMEDLERILKETNASYEKSRAPLNRRFIVTEGIFENTGDICNLPKIVELKEKYKYRSIIDESMSMGVIGSRGAGITDFFNIDPNRVDLIVFALTNAFSSSGGICCAKPHLIEHQRLSSAAYTFSASLPAMLAITAIDVLRMIESSRDIHNKLLENIQVAQSILNKSLSGQVDIHPSISSIDDISKSSIENSPLISISLPKDFIPQSAHSEIIRTYHVDTDAILKNPTRLLKSLKNPELELALNLEQEKVLQEIVDEVLRNGVFITKAKYVRDQEQCFNTPNIRLSISAGISKKDMEKAINVVVNAFKKILKLKKY